MALSLDRFADVNLTGPLLDVLITEHQRASLPRLRRLWMYYRNPSTDSDWLPGRRTKAGRTHRLGQEIGLPARLGGGNGAGWWGVDASLDDRTAKAGGREVVIENDIAWRLHTMVDFLFGKPVRFISQAADQATRDRVQQTLDQVWEASGGIALLQDMALLGHVYGHVDLVVRSGGVGVAPAIEVIEPTRGIPLLNPGDFRAIDAYILHYERQSAEVEPAYSGFARAAQRWLGRGTVDPMNTDGPGPRRRLSTITEILSGARRQVYDSAGGDRSGPRLVLEEPNLVSPGRPPVVHIQNQSQPFVFGGLSEVEPLIPLQDELNTRLSDRASRVTLQSFKMYLAKGIDGFAAMPVAPGSMWSTDNPDASIEAFGGDGHSPSEERHIEEIREALDKTSGVPPLATGVVRAKVGNLTSENALRITLTGLLSKTARKRITYGRGLADACRLVLDAMDHSGALSTDVADRAVRIEWPEPLPRDEEQVLRAAKAKVDLGVAPAEILAELGYAQRDEGVI